MTDNESSKKPMAEMRSWMRLRVKGVGEQMRVVSLPLRRCTDPLLDECDAKRSSIEGLRSQSRWRNYIRDAI